MAGKEVAQMVALDPMLAVVEVSERKLAGINVGDKAKVRLVTGQMAEGKIRFVSKSASQTTRTYRVEAELKNADGAIPDGITAEVYAAACADAADARCAFGADILVGRRSRRARRRRRRQGAIPSASACTKTSRPSCGSTACRRARA